jgi:hypothetical protein
MFRVDLRDMGVILSHNDRNSNRLPPGYQFVAATVSVSVPCKRNYVTVMIFIGELPKN